MTFASWDNYESITINSSQVDADLTDFVVAINLADLSSDFHSHVKSDGGDIRAAKADGTELPIDLVAIDTVSETGELHVKYTGTLSSSADTTINIYYNNTGASAYANDATYGAEAVWSHLYGVLHFEEDPTNSSPQFYDSTGNGVNGTAQGSGWASGDSVVGKLGGNALNLDGNSFSNKVNISTSALSAAGFSQQDFTISMWVEDDKDSGTVSYYFDLQSPRTAIHNIGLADGSVRFEESSALDTSSGLIGGAWDYISCSAKTSISTKKIHINGVQRASNTSPSGTSTSPSGTASIMARFAPGANTFTNGRLDEFRIGPFQDASYGITEYNNQNSTSTFYSTSGENSNIPADLTDPALSSSTPANNATGVARNSNIVLNFDEDVAKGTGNITIKLYSDDSDVEVIDVTSGLVTVSGSQVTINPSSDLPNLELVYVFVDATAIDDTSGNSYAGISSKDTLKFTTADEIGPALSSSTPADNDTGIAVDANIVLNFDQNIVKGTGNITIKRYSDDSDVEVIDVTSGLVTVSGSQVTVNPSSDLPDDERIYLLVGSTCFEDTSGNNYAGISSKDTLDFTTIDLTAPTLSSSTPADNATGMVVDANIVLNFDEDVAKGTGNITIKLYSDDSDVEVIDVTSGLVTVSGSQVTINPSSDLSPNTQYYLLIDATAIDDTSGNSYAGISNKDTLNFRTVDNVNPILSSSVPSPGSETFPPSDNIVLNFDEDVAKGTGNITIKLYSDDSDVEVIDVTSGLVTVSGSQVTINPSSDLSPNTQYYLLIDATAIDDTSGNSYAGISSKDTLSFTTVPVSVESLTPTDNSTGNAVDVDLELDFNQNVSSGSGNVSIYQRPNLKIGSTDFAGDIGEILVSKTELSEDDRKNIEGYLAWRWFGPANPLPVDHPFKYRGPSI